MDLNDADNAAPADAQRRHPMSPGPPRPFASDSLPAAAVPLWPLPLLAALLPALGAVVALVLYQAQSPCFPFVEDCVSISRMARQGPANPIFRALTLPGAVLQALVWLIAALALATAGLSRRAAALLALTGVGAALALIVYGSFLGTDGAIYRWLRRHGTLLYFVGTYVALLLFARHARQAQRSGALAPSRRPMQLLVGLLAFIGALGVLHGLAAAARLEALENRIENLTEWWGGLAMTIAFTTMAVLWRRWGVAARLSIRSPAAG
jgi:hypothetical protein